jgi:hypothetical protein
MSVGDRTYNGLRSSYDQIPPEDTPPGVERRLLLKVGPQSRNA